MESTPPNLVEIPRMIGRHIKNAAGNKGATDRGQELIVHEAARRMPPLWPRIGKHQVESCDGIGRQHFRDRVRNLERHHSRISQTSMFELPTVTADPSEL